MSLSRRRFFQFLAAATPVLALDPEELLWKPGSKLISVPKPLPPKIIGVDWTNPLVVKGFESKYSWVGKQKSMRELEITPLYEKFSLLQDRVTDEMVHNYQFRHLELPPRATGGFVTGEHFLENERVGRSCSQTVRYLKVRDDAAGVVHNRLEILMVPTRG